MGSKLPTPFSIKGKKIWVAGHLGMVGSATVRRLASEDCIVLASHRNELDLRDQAAVKTWLKENQPDIVLIAAATVGGILANSTRPAEFLYDNLLIEANIINSSYEIGVEKLLFLGSACIYPREAIQPMSEECLLSGPLEPTNQWYAIAKIAGIKLCEAYRKQYGCDFISAQPNNLYGNCDNFDPLTGHVIPALIVKTHSALINGKKSIKIWGTGKPKREFLHVDDLADALIYLLKYYSSPVQINVGTGNEISIRELAEIIAKIIGFKGKLMFDSSKPDGAPRKLLDTTRMRELDWNSKIDLISGLHSTYEWYLKNVVKSSS